jgi:hypothetical protein
MPDCYASSIAAAIHPVATPTVTASATTQLFFNLGLPP